jgi:molybdenum cofactor cytidylyltransferase
MTAAIVLAAGMSSRMGTLKQLLPFGNSTVLGSVIENLQAAGVDRVVVVLGHEAEKVRQAVDNVGVEFVLNEEYVVGMFSSVQAGVRALPADTETVLICLGDQPGICSETIRALIATFGRCGNGIGIPFTQNDQGHPLFVSGKYLNELQLMSPTLTLKHFLSAHANDIARLPIEDGAVLRDIDTPAEYEAERRHYSCDI